MKESSVKSNIKTLQLCIAVILVIFSCRSIEKEKMGPIESKLSFLPPVTVSLDTCPPPKIIELKNVPPPLFIPVPESTGGSYINNLEGGGKEIKLSQPIITNALSPVAHFSNFNTEDGLPIAAVLSGWRDRKGRLWFGTGGGGVSCYDGNMFTNFNPDQGLVNGGIRCIGEDNLGNLWFGSAGSGVSQYDGIRFTNYTTKDGLADNTVFSITTDKNGKLWFGTLRGASCYDGKTFSTFDTSNGLPYNNVNMIRADRNGDLWIATFGGGVSRYDGKKFTTYTTRDGLPTDYITSILEDKGGDHWFGTYNGGVSRFDGKTFITYTTDNGLAGNSVESIAEENDGLLWFASRGGGVSSYDGTNFTTFNTENGLADNDVMAITKDQHGNLWFSTMAGGLSRYNGKALRVLSSKQGLTERIVWNLKEDRKGNLWFATNGDGLYRFDGKQFTRYTTSQGLNENLVNNMAVDSAGNIWLTTFFSGVCRFDGEGFTTYTTAQGLTTNSFTAVSVDKSGNLWFGTMDGEVSKFDGKSFTNYTSKHGLTGKVLTCILEDKSGNLWFGSSEGGVSRFDGKAFTTFTTKNGLANDYIVEIKEDKSGNLWFGTQGSGVSRYDGTDFISFSSQQGLADGTVYCIIEDEDGVIWVGTNEGLSGLKFKIPIRANKPAEIKGAGLMNMNNEQLRSCEPVWEYYNTHSGYPIKDLNERSICLKKRPLPFGKINDVGTFWASSGNKVLCFDPRAVFKNSAAPAVFIRSIKIDEATINWYGQKKTKPDSTVLAQQESMVYGKPLALKARDSLQKRFSDIQFDSITPFYQLPLNLKLPYHHNRVDFDFGAIETSRNFMVRYQHMLEGYDKEWSPISEKKSASYGNISEGSYTFKLRARSPEGVWSTPIEYEFKMLPPWWRTWWAYLSYLILFSMAIYTIIHWRTRSLKQEKLKLEEKVSQRTIQLQHKSTELAESLENLKSTQGQLIQSAKMASLGELTAGIAHEIQNPLNFVNNFSEVNKELLDELHEVRKSEPRDLQNESELLHDIEQNLEKVIHHGRRADSIVKGMLQHSATSTGQKEPTDINALADEYLRLSYHGMRAKDKHFEATMKTDFEPAIGKINIIPQDIGRVLLNMYNNAFYTVNEKKNHKGDGYEPAISISTKKVNDKIEISVKDNGKGIPEKVKEKIFQPFFTTKPTGQGTGLGLSLSYDIIKAHGGEIKMQTKEGEWTEFSVTLPVGSPDTRPGN